MQIRKFVPSRYSWESGKWTEGKTLVFIDTNKFEVTDKRLVVEARQALALHLRVVLGEPLSPTRNNFREWWRGDKSWEGLYLLSEGKTVLINGFRQLPGEKLLEIRVSRGAHEHLDLLEVYE